MTCESALQLIEDRSGLTSRQSQRPQPSRFLLRRKSRPLRSWLTCNVRQRMRSRYNPTAEDLRTWAYDSSSEEPAQDWDLSLATIPYDDLFLEFASDVDCPKRDYFLSLLYLIVGDAV